MTARWMRAPAGLLLLLTAVACEVTPPPPSTPTEATPLPQATPPPSAELVETTVPPTPTAEEPLAAIVNGEPITLADYEREMERYEASLKAQGVDPESQEGQERLNQTRGWILDMMVEQVLTSQAAEQAGIEVTAEQVGQYMETMVADSGGEEAFRAKLAEWGETYEDASREVRAQLIGMAMTERIVAAVPTSSEQIHARHILVDTAEEAAQIREQLEAGADFSSLAKAHSLDQSTRDNGGDLGYFPRGILVATEVEDAAFELQPGQVSDVIGSALGYHVVQVVERDPDHPVSPESLQLLRERAVQEWVESMWAQAEVQRLVEAALQEE